MFSQSKVIVFLCSALLVTTMLVGHSFGQYRSRSSALQQAQMRGQRAAQNQTTQQRRTPRGQNDTRVAQGSGSRVVEGSPVLRNAPVINSSPVVGGPSAAISGGYNPPHLQSNVVGSSVVSGGPIVDGGSPIISDGYIEEGYGYEGGYDDGGCGSCGGYFEGDICANRNGGCGPACWENCWINVLGGIFSNAELVAGAQGFRSRVFNAGNQVVDDSSFGFYGGVNLGLSLCRLTCGLFSGQIGVRSSQSEFEGDLFSTDNRDQLFVTAGVFRRVDYGIQAGVVVDFLRENWFVETNLTQVRGDIGWVYPGGNTLGFRFAYGTEDDLTDGFINGVAFNNLASQVIDNYRFYYRMTSNNTGHCDIFAGWSDLNQAVLGLDVDMPVNGIWGIQSGFAYFLPESTTPAIPSSTQDAWNLYVGIAIRPQGLGWYGNYDRPLLNVADNGTFVFDRN